MDRLSGGNSVEGERQQATPETRQAGAPGANGAVDMALLADRVYRLLLADLRLTQRRGAVHARQNG
jgi:hypothetical protein